MKKRLMMFVYIFIMLLILFGIGNKVMGKYTYHTAVMQKIYPDSEDYYWVYVNPETTIKEFIKQVANFSGDISSPGAKYVSEVKSKSGGIKAKFNKVGNLEKGDENLVICTGDKVVTRMVNATESNQSWVQEIQVLVYGDINGDGLYSYKDYLKLSNYLYGNGEDDSGEYFFTEDTTVFYDICCGEDGGADGIYEYDCSFIFNDSPDKVNLEGNKIGNYYVEGNGLDPDYQGCAIEITENERMALIEMMLREGGGDLGQCMIEAQVVRDTLCYNKNYKGKNVKDVICNAYYSEYYYNTSSARKYQDESSPYHENYLHAAFAIEWVFDQGRSAAQCKMLSCMGDPWCPSWSCNISHWNNYKAAGGLNCVYANHSYVNESYNYGAMWTINSDYVNDEYEYGVIYGSEDKVKQ